MYFRYSIIMLVFLVGCIAPSGYPGLLTEQTSIQLSSHCRIEKVFNAKDTKIETKEIH